MKKLFYILPILVLFVQCSKTEKATEITENEQETTKVKLHEGEKLMKQYCYACHSPTGSEETQAAPPMIAVKRHYMMGNPSQEDFAQSMLEFIENPTDKNAIMHGAVDRFGVMPKMVFGDEKMLKITDFLYNHDPEIPDWFEEYYQKNHGKGNAGNGQGKGYLPKGKKIALQTKAVLGKNLMNAIQTQGTEAALEFCSVRAIPLTDSMAIALNAKVKRVSDKNRNPNNAANEVELNYMNLVKKQLLDGETVKPQMQKINGKHVGYYPILTNQMCLQCHGKPNEQVKAATLAKINAKYPNDKAMGYGENELRGIWVIEMD